MAWRHPLFLITDRRHPNPPTFKKTNKKPEAFCSYRKHECMGTEVLQTSSTCNLLWNWRHLKPSKIKHLVESSTGTFIPYPRLRLVDWLCAMWLKYIIKIVPCESFPLSAYLAECIEKSFKYLIGYLDFACMLFALELKTRGTFWNKAWVESSIETYILYLRRNM